ncbi:MAG: hypothetical protein JKY31_01910 [Rhodobacteraceae bacterium]|nr:hypothetical protein [Paracoccaceae bacterium]
MASAASAQVTSFRGYLTGYSYWDNTPPGSAAISNPQIHEFAGGVGTYFDPITIAVGHVIDGADVLDFPAGTRFYLPHLRKYAIVEDTCGDGDSPQDGPCHIGKDGLPWLDIYVDGATSDAARADACSEKITTIQTFVVNPGPNHSVVVGALTESGCYTFPDL